MKNSIYNASVVAFGDSITMGIGVPRSSRRWTEQIRMRFNLQLVNSGIGGDSTISGLERLQTDVLDYNPDFVLVCFGMNDHFMTEKGTPIVPKPVFVDNIVQMIACIREIDAVPILITPNYIIEGDRERYYYSRHNPDFYTDTGGPQAWLDTYIEEIRKIAQAKSVDLIDIRKVCDQYDPYMFLRSLKNDIFADGVHPHVLGAGIYAETIGNYLETHFGNKNGVAP